LRPCRNDSDNNICAEAEEVEKYLSGAYFDFRTINHNVESLHIKPFETLASGERFAISNSVFKRIWMSLKTVNYTSDFGYILEDKSLESFYIINGFVNEVDMRETNRGTVPGSFLWMTVLNLKSTITYHRTYMKAQNFLANVGGIIKGISVIGLVLNYIISNRLYSLHLINHLPEVKYRVFDEYSEEAKMNYSRMASVQVERSKSIENNQPSNKDRRVSSEHQPKHSLKRNNSSVRRSLDQGKGRAYQADEKANDRVNDKIKNIDHESSTKLHNLERIVSSKQAQQDTNGVSPLNYSRKNKNNISKDYSDTKLFTEKNEHIIGSNYPRLLYSKKFPLHNNTSKVNSNNDIFMIRNNFQSNKEQNDSSNNNSPSELNNWQFDKQSPDILPNSHVSIDLREEKIMPNKPLNKENLVNVIEFKSPNQSRSPKKYDSPVVDRKVLPVLKKYEDIGYPSEHKRKQTNPFKSSALREVDEIPIHKKYIDANLVKNSTKIILDKYQFLFCTFCYSKNNIKLKLYNRSYQMLQEELDITNVLNKLTQFEKFKLSFMTVDQLTLFNYLFQTKKELTDSESVIFKHEIKHEEFISAKERTVEKGLRDNLDDYILESLK